MLGFWYFNWTALVYKQNRQTERLRIQMHRERYESSDRRTGKCKDKHACTIEEMILVQVNKNRCTQIPKEGVTRR